jgi:hypothetical protein
LRRAETSGCALIDAIGKDQAPLADRGYASDALRRSAERFFDD